MSIMRSLLIIMVALASNALYIQGQYVYHAKDRWEAIRMISLKDLPISIAALVILAVFVILEFYFAKKEELKADKKEEQRRKQLDAKFDQLIAAINSQKVKEEHNVDSNRNQL